MKINNFWKYQIDLLSNEQTKALLFGINWCKEGQYTNYSGQKMSSSIQNTVIICHKEQNHNSLCYVGIPARVRTEIISSVGKSHLPIDEIIF